MVEPTEEELIQSLTTIYKSAFHQMPLKWLVSIASVLNEEIKEKQRSG